MKGGISTVVIQIFRGDVCCWDGKETLNRGSIIINFIKFIMNIDVNIDICKVMTNYMLVMLANIGLDVLL